MQREIAELLKVSNPMLISICKEKDILVLDMRLGRNLILIAARRCIA